MEIATRRREQEVWQACDDLWAAFGDMKHITGDGIRERLLNLGKSRGSPNEIYKYRKTWLLSRGLNFSDHDAASSSDTDPITRAVRLVHDQLHERTQSQIDACKTEFEEKLLAKEQEIIEKKKSLDNVLAEFGHIEQKLVRTQDELKNTAAQLQAEIDVRRALEKEIELKKSLHHADITNAELRMQEIKTKYDNELARLNHNAFEQHERFERQLKDLTAQMQTAGHDYSERLMDLKIKMVNQDIVARQQEEKLAHAHEKMQGLHAEIRSLREEMSKAQAEKINLETERFKTHNDLQNEKQKVSDLCARNDHCERSLKKAELTIARLRAWVQPHKEPHRGRP